MIWHFQPSCKSFSKPRQHSARLLPSLVLRSWAIESRRIQLCHDRLEVYKLSRSTSAMIDSNLFSTTIGRLAARVWVTPALRSSVVSALRLRPVFDFQSRNLFKVDPVACHECCVGLQSDGGNCQVHLAETWELLTQSSLCLNGEL